MKNWLLAILLLLNGFCLFRITQLNRKSKETMLAINAKNDLLATVKGQQFKLKANLFAEEKLEESAVPVSLFKQYQDSLPLIVLRVHINNCNDCVKESLKHLEKLNKDFGIKPVVLAKFPSEEALKTTFPVKIPFVLSGLLPQDSVQVSKPYLFIIDKSGKMKYVFFPEWDMTDLMDAYFGKIERLYKKES